LVSDSEDTAHQQRSAKHLGYISEL